MNTRAIGDLTIRPLRNGDTATVAAFFARLGDRSRRSRFAGPKPRLSEDELELMARVGRDRHALVAYRTGDPLPVGIAELVRSAADPKSAEIAFAVADEHQGRGIGRTLVDLLLADARAAGLTRVTAFVSGSNPAALALVRGAAEVDRMELVGSQIELQAAI